MCSLRLPLLLAVLLSSACAPGVYVRRLVPARDNLGSARRLAVLEIRGPPGTEGVVYNELARQVANRRHFSLLNGLGRGLTVVIPGFGAQVELGQIRQQVEADFYLVAFVTDFRQFSEFETRNKVTLPRQVGEARLSMQVVRADGRVVVYREVSGRELGPDPFSSSARTQAQPSDLAQRAVREAVDHFLYDITPHYVTEKIEFEDAEDLQPGIKLAEAEDYAGAQKLWQDLVARNPNHAGAIYNIGVVYEIQGEFDGAKAWYRRAIEIQPTNERFIETERALFKRLEDSARLDQKI